jgi:ketosteroid isomerase-like protein
MTAREPVERLYQAFATGDVPTALALLDESVEWKEADGFPYAGTYRGPQAVLEGVLARLGSEWHGFKVVPDRIVAEGEHVVSFGTYSGAYKATGKSFTARYAHVFRVEGSKIVQFEQIVDTAEVNKAL